MLKEMFIKFISCTAEWDGQMDGGLGRWKNG